MDADEAQVEFERLLEGTRNMKRALNFRVTKRAEAERAEQDARNELARWDAELRKHVDKMVNLGLHA